LQPSPKWLDRFFLPNDALRVPLCQQRPIRCGVAPTVHRLAVELQLLAYLRIGQPGLLEDEFRDLQVGFVAFGRQR